MRRLRTIALYGLPLSIFVIACVKSYQITAEYWPTPVTPDDDRLLRRPLQILVALVGLFAPMPLCAAASLRLSKRRASVDAVGLLLTHLAVLVAVELSVFFGLVATGLVSASAFLTAHGVLALCGLAASGSPGRNASRPAADVLSVRRSYRTHLLIVTALAWCGLVSVHLGKDIGYDFYNYHHYNAYAYLNGRAHVDFALADIATHLNPYLDVANYLVFRSVRPVWAGFIVGAAHGVAAVLLYGIAYEVLGQTGLLRKARSPLAVACAVAGVCEPIFLGQLGTTFHDALLTSFVLTSLLLVLRQVDRRDRPRVSSGVSVAALSGLFAGAATGFKLTTATFALALAFVLLINPTGWRRRFGLIVAFGVGGIGGFLATNGYWMACLYADYGSPLFPVYNSLFKSAYYPETDISYLNLTASLGWVDHLLMPFYWATKSKLLSETPSSDLRPAIAYVLLALASLNRALALLRADWRSLSKLREALSGPLAPGATLLITFVVVSYLIWYRQFRILRYLVPIKVLLPLVCVLLLADLCRSRRRVWAASAILLGLMAGSFDVPNWGRGNWKKRDFLGYTVQKIDAEEHGIVLMNSKTSSGGLNAFAALTTILPPTMRYVRIDSVQVANPFGGRPLKMELEVKQLLRDHRGPIFLLTHNEPAALSFATKLLRTYGLAIADGQQPKRITGSYADLGYWRLERRAEATGTGGIAASPRQPVTR